MTPMQNTNHNINRRAVVAALFCSYRYCARLVCASPELQAVSPAPDGGYANFNTAEGTDALFSLTTGVGIPPSVVTHSITILPARVTRLVVIMRFTSTPVVSIRPMAGARSTEIAQATITRRRVIKRLIRIPEGRRTRLTAMGRSLPTRMEATTLPKALLRYFATPLACLTRPLVMRRSTATPSVALTLP